MWVNQVDLIKDLHFLKGVKFSDVFPDFLLISGSSLIFGRVIKKTHFKEEVTNILDNVRIVKS